MIEHDVKVRRKCNESLTMSESNVFRCHGGQTRNSKNHSLSTTVRLRLLTPNSRNFERRLILLPPFASGHSLALALLCTVSSLSLLDYPFLNLNALNAAV